ncbi:Uncharacterized protein PCOAH_00052440 [Plasmodium coatneyi]|uniref:Uncharacterized protein n=1 Tax=Plasmodium coatneyi TaxID=208452 RepID=A0A1B1E7V3_9APIC|nr:Uncharacterized protein PCOAH_00052440 [Plasmodium coatneyi]ANQ10849.1 Uncharacterized protein PCOAH_00052440 [Plasmodium coatneyi]
MKEPTSQEQLRHSYVDKVPFLKNVESPHRLNIKDQVEKYERKEKKLKREMYKFISSIKNGHKQRHHVNYNLGVLCRTSLPYVNISSLSTHDGGTINGHAHKLQTGCSSPKERNHKKKTSPCRNYENEGDFKKHNFLWNRDGYHERGYQNYLHALLKRKDFHSSSIFGEYSHRRREPDLGMLQSEGLSHLGGKKLYREVHQNGYKGKVGSPWGDQGEEFPTCGLTPSGLTSPRKSMKMDVNKRAIHEQNGRGHQRSSSNCSSESTKIIDQFVKSIEGNQSGGKEKVNFGAVLPESNPLHGMNTQNLSIPDGYTSTTRKSKTHAADQDALTVLSEYRQMVMDNKKMLTLLQRVMYQVEVTNRSSQINKKIEKVISTYLRKVERMMRKYREAIKCDDFNKSRKLYRYFRAIEMVMLRCVLNYVIDLMHHVKYECKDLRREIEREICEVQLAIWQTLRRSPPVMRQSA